MKAVNELELLNNDSEGRTLVKEEKNSVQYRTKLKKKHYYY